MVLATVACTKSNDLDPIVNKAVSLNAILEQPVSADTKAELNGSYQTLWRTGDVIKVFIENGTGDWNTQEDFTLSSADRSTSGTFHCDTEYSETDHWDRFAFFPYYYTGPTGATNTGSNVGGDKKMYFNLPSAYYDYTSGQSFLPLVANLGLEGVKHPSSANFKFVGGAVVVNLTGVPGAAKSLGMIVEGKRITGFFDAVEQSNIGTASGIITAEAGSGNEVWFNFDSSGSVDRTFKFIYPVPVINETSNLTFKMYDKNNLLIWQKTASGQSAIGRAQALVMPSKPVTPIPQNMYLVGYWGSEDHNDGEAFNNSTGSVSVTFPSEAYVCLRAADTGNWYMTDALVEGTTATVKAQSGNKLHITTAGTYTFSMAYQSDGSIVLSYE